ncbi:GNAT family N-acetyltransferase [Humidisolicoccus flavus]|uniref:GNAT family N-acetyltransferase n=1 Tax=Humidisolicoccus flavus TaxID=3111414 RepID=UPI003255744D
MIEGAERLVLRQWIPEQDAAAVNAAIRDSELQRQAPGVTDAVSARRYLEDLQSEGDLAYAIELNGSVVGNVAASGLRGPHRTAWMSYWTVRSVRGRGFASRALATISIQCFKAGVHRLELGARTNNPASLRVAENAGFVREGTEREALQYGQERFDVARFARLVSDPAPALSLITLVSAGQADEERMVTA